MLELPPRNCSRYFCPKTLKQDNQELMKRLRKLTKERQEMVKEFQTLRDEQKSTRSKVMKEMQQ